MSIVENMLLNHKTYDTNQIKEDCINRFGFDIIGYQLFKVYENILEP